MNNFEYFDFNFISKCLDTPPNEMTSKNLEALVRQYDWSGFKKYAIFISDRPSMKRFVDVGHNLSISLAGVKSLPGLGCSCSDARLEASNKRLNQ